MGYEEIFGKKNCGIKKQMENYSPIFAKVGEDRELDVTGGYGLSEEERRGTG